MRFDYGRNFEEWWQRDISAMVLRDRNHPSVAIWSIGNEIPEVVVEKGPAMAKQLAAQVRSLDTSRPLTQALPTSTSGPLPDALLSVLDIGGYNYNLAQNYAEDHRRVPSRLMVTTESFPAEAFEQWKLAKDNPFIIGEFVWTAMDYLGESGIGASAYGTPEQAALAGKMMGGMQGMVDQMFLAMANGIDMRALMAQAGKSNPAAESAMSVLSTLSMARIGVRRPRPDRAQETAVVLSRHSVERWRSRVRNRAPARAGREENHRRRDGPCIRRFRAGPGPARKVRSCRWKFTREWTRYGFTSTTS